MPTSRAPLEPGTVAAALREAGATGRVVVVERTASTSADVLAGLASRPADWPDRSVLVADHQDGGRGRRGRTWTTPPRAALTFSTVLRPGAAVPPDRWGWLPLLAGLAVVEAVEQVTGVRAVLKWPNDVLVDDAGEDLPGWGSHRKVVGILGDLAVVPEGRAAVVGIGVNVDQAADELPVPTATSLRLAGNREPGAASSGAPDRTLLLAATVRALVALDERWRAAGGDVRAAGLDTRVAAVCATLGQAVRVELPGERTLTGVARSLAPDGSLEVVDAAGRVHTVLAGDVHHTRWAG
ncbi:biotin--acetyl-CoA-carboxylase ligase [Actinotalea ferrariae CF5-4]|uniref:biotin--[biotin carboxyl-carrier protein] ligase n=1 Tax=Actinotalea ferrariae CF5-4 TaxID=948458 RepID=A0A021VWJ3_9CELL|nr:biotin--[acetyl-CoA-carboxylase] ligase [Actinotalea ferrariae]EYR63427.1 biotin--acetyl-CoA-carboxylase ligase [Actinotalea ferrariae CF5-4]